MRGAGPSAQRARREVADAAGTLLLELLEGGWGWWLCMQLLAQDVKACHGVRGVRQQAAQELLLLLLLWLEHGVANSSSRKGDSGLQAPRGCTALEEEDSLRVRACGERGGLKRVECVTGGCGKL